MMSSRSITQTMTFPAFALAIVACVGDAATPSSSDAGTDATALADSGPDSGTSVDAASDADASAPACDPNKDFGKPVQGPFATLNTPADERHPFLSDDELTVYFGGYYKSGDAGSSFDLYMATRATVGDSFGAAMPLPGAINVSGAAEEHDAVLTPDGLTLFFDKNQSGVTSGYEVWSSVRATPSAPWPAPAPVANVNHVGGVLGTGVDGLWNGDLLVSNNTHNDSSGPHFAIARAPKSGSGFGTPIVFDELGDSLRGHLTADGLRIYYNANSGSSIDIWTGVRSSTSAAFTQLQRVDGLSSSASDAASWLSADGCRIYLMSDRAGGAGNYDMYVAARPK